eukprot:577764-Prymnesium_polylepis.1
MSHYIFINGQGAGVEAKYRATLILNAIERSLSAPTESYFIFVRSVIRQRWAALAAALAGQEQYAIDGSPDGAALYAWLRCPSAGPQCVKHFARFGMRVSAGDEFGAAATDRHVRLI